MSFVAIDLGASGSRYTTDSGQISVVPNNMVILPDNETSKIKPDAADIESCLEVHITKDSGEACEHFPANVLVGIMAEKHPDTDIRPSSLTTKPRQRVNYISTIVACALARLKYNVEETFDLYLAVPPSQVDEANEKFGSMLVGTYTVRFPKYMEGTEVKLNIANGIDISEESFMAITSFFFNMNGTIREAAKPYMSATVLSIDIGASTSDLAIVKNGRYLDKSGQTYQYGGNVARSALMNSVRKSEGFEIPPEYTDITMAEGRLKSGMRYKDFSIHVQNAKKALANKLVQCIQDYFSNNEIPITMIDAIVVSGGGSMDSHYTNDDGEIIKTAEPMSYYVTEAIKQYSPDTEIVAYGDEARLANIKGLFIKAKMESVRKAQKRAAQAQVVAPTPVATQPTVAPTPVATQPTVAPTPVATQPTVAPTPVATQPTVASTPVATQPTVAPTPVANPVV